MIRKLLLVIIFCLLGRVRATANFNYDATCIEAYKAILSLRINEGRILIQKEKQINPQNGIIILLENYADYFTLLTSESKTDYERRKDLKSTRISVLENNDSNSPFYLYSQAEVYLQWSFLKAKFGDYVSSAFDAKKASGLLKDNAEKYPDFAPNQKCTALVNIIFGSIPASFKGITRFMGMNGNVQAGIKQLEDLRVGLPKTKYAFYDNEVIFFLCNANIDGLHNYGAYPRLIGYLSGMESNSLLKGFLEGYIAAKSAHNDDAIGYFEACPKSNQYVKVPMISYFWGCAKLNRMDSDADLFLANYIKEFKGINYIKDAYLKLAYYYLLQNDGEKYMAYINMVKSKGYAVDEKDKQALREANDVKPDIDLLKARFYFDGGYYTKALDQIKSKAANDLKLLRDKTELYYRLGRIYDKTGQTANAISNYRQAINLGRLSNYYFAANAALNSGRIFEEKKDYNKAAEYYNEALAMHDHQYQTDIDNDAKAGLKRIGK